MCHNMCQTCVWHTWNVIRLFTIINVIIILDLQVIIFMHKMLLLLWFPFTMSCTHPLPASGVGPKGSHLQTSPEACLWLMGNWLHRRCLGCYAPFCRDSSWANDCLVRGVKWPGPLASVQDNSPGSCKENNLCLDVFWNHTFCLASRPVLSHFPHSLARSSWECHLNYWLAQDSETKENDLRDPPKEKVVCRLFLIYFIYFSRNI